jgi:hypothetical protein
MRFPDSGGILILEKLNQRLVLPPVDLIRRAGYQNIAKGLRRSQALMNGDLDSSRGLIFRTILRSAFQ